MSIIQIKHDINGNPRRVSHFLEWLTPSEIEYFNKETPGADHPTSYLYDVALKRARLVGGKKYHNRSYGGGIVLQAYSNADVVDAQARAFNASNKLPERGWYLKGTTKATVQVVKVGINQVIAEFNDAREAAQHVLDYHRQVGWVAPAKA